MIDIHEDISLKFIDWPEISRATEQVHKAVQWIARLGKAYVPSQADDSHINMGWNSEEEYFYGHWFADYSLRLAFRPNDFAWLILDENFTINDSLGGWGRTDEDVWEWLQISLNKRGVDADLLQYDLHYNLPYEHDLKTVYGIVDEAVLNAFSRLRTLGNLMTKAALLFANPGNIQGGIRTWPHHFDAGCSIPLAMDNKEEVLRSLGVGMAIHDQMINQYYLYVSSWTKNSVFNYHELPDLPSGGYWVSSEGWNGAVLPFDKLREPQSFLLDKGVLFLIAAIETISDLKPQNISNQV